MSAALIDAGNGLIEAYDGGSTLGIEKAKAAWAEAVESFDEQAEDLDLDFEDADLTADESPDVTDEPSDPEDVTGDEPGDIEA